jgi:N-acetylglucosamine kinase-like BadF-type ATPase
VELQVDNDGVIAWAGALSLRPGLIAIAGSGSLVLGFDAAGQTERAGGWGYLFGDEPGAFGIALAGIKAAMRRWDAGRRGTPLETAICRHFGTQDIFAVSKGFYAGEIARTKIASLTPVLAELAREDDAEVASLFREAALVLADQLIQVAQRLEWAGGAIPWSPIGGVFRSAALFTEPLKARLSSAPGLKFDLVEPEFTPAAGAVLLARTRVGGEALTPAFCDRLRAGLASRINPPQL